MRTALAGLLLVISAPAAAECDNFDTGVQDTAVKYEDCDDDGYRKMDGDCDDYDGDVHPDREEDCGDPDDNNCDGFFNEGCSGVLQHGTLTGGGCGGTGSEALLLLPLLLVGRRR